MNKGIYTLANDTVYDQLVAFLNSVEVNANNISVCIIPYNSRLDKIKRHIYSRRNVFLFDNYDSIEKWKVFAKDVWAARSASKVQSRHRRPWYYQSNTILKLCSFDGRFEKFVYCDSDSLVMKPFDDVFEKLNTYDLVFDDWEHNKADRIALLDLSKIEKTGTLTRNEAKKALHGSDFFGGKSQFLGQDLATIKNLIAKEDIEWIPKERCWDEVPLFCYITLKTNLSYFNFTQSNNVRDRTGNCANADPFVEKDHVLYNQEGIKPIHRIHYMGYTPDMLKRLCAGEDVDICYRDIFLHYRFIKEPEKRPKILIKPNLFLRGSRVIRKILHKLYIFLK